MIDLRSFSDTDIPLFETWLGAPHVAPWFARREDWLAEVRLRHSRFSFISHFIAEEDGLPFGFCQFYCCGKSGEEEYQAFPPDTTFSIDYLIGEAGHLRRGYGRRMLSLLIERIKATTGCRLIAVKPERENHASIGVLQSAGFRFLGGSGILCLDLRSGR